MIDHVSLPVSDLAASRRFYEAALEPLGLKPVHEAPGHVLYALKGGGWLGLDEREQTAPVHIAFGADRVAVDAFHEAALAAGGTDNGAPGIRARYHEHYYGAYVLDPDGHNVEAVSHGPE